MKENVFFLLLILFLYANSSPHKKEKELIITNDKIYELTDADFDFFIQNGQNYKWFVLFYVSTCGHCRRARKEIKAIFDKNITDPNIRFAQIETNSNMMASIRFNVTQIPYITLISNNTMIELQKYPNAKNLEEFLKISFNQTDLTILPIPAKPTMFYVTYLMMKESFESVRLFFNRKIKEKGFNFQLKSNHLIIALILTITLIIFIEIRIISFYNREDLFMKEIEKKLQEKEQIKKENDNKKEEYLNPQSGEQKPDLKKE